MKAYSDWESVQPYQFADRLPAGGYVCKIMGVEEQETQYARNLVISLDIAEGECKGYYEDNYRNQTQEPKKWKGVCRVKMEDFSYPENNEKCERKWKTIVSNIEAANPGYHFDFANAERDLKGKIIGAMFRNKEYEFNGKHGFWTECCWLESAEKIRSGKFEIPEDKLLQSNQNSGGFAPITAGEADGDLPF